MTSLDQSQGGLFYIVGASSLGKDSLIHAVCELAQPEDNLCIAPRYITRPVSELDQYIALLSSKLEHQREAGGFLFDWFTHGFDYAVSTDIRSWVMSGRRVLIDGSPSLS